MSLRKLPEVKAFSPPEGYTWDMPPAALDEWSGRPQAAEADDPNTVSIFGAIGEDFWSGDGFTAKRMAGALRSIGKNAVTVNINSPGGDMFEGLAIYNLLREHKAQVTVKVMGIAASAASIIAMAGDTVQMGVGSIMMIHNAWGLVIGNRNDFADAADVFKTFDESMAAIYADRTGMTIKEILAMLDGPSRASDGSYLTAAEAIEKGFADGTFEGDSAAIEARVVIPADVMAKRRMEAALAKDGVGRKERFDLINSLLGQRDAAQPARRDAGALPTADILSAIAVLRS
ncbi:ATP-dependent protease ClpP protease subunit [Rhodoligotrophos appendicifer]|uniref:head maturation protease, ClpP-related n=1 Tax=Rhodoligotrophos appendicifer TaxID=987056 RepID=UPI0011852DFB|nr:head maturation protease, ClpP-related [Rhodoligotrophos appendicifer]